MGSVCVRFLSLVVGSDLVAMFGSIWSKHEFSQIAFYASVRMRSETYGSHFVCVCVFVPSTSAFSVDFGHR